MKIGIGITTRKRPDVLKTCLDHFSAFPTPNSKVVVVEDDHESDSTVESLVSDFQKGNLNVEVVFRKAPSRLGISRAKNACISKLDDCDHVFLFDDDTWPKTHGWAEKWIEINEMHEASHSMWLTQLVYADNLITSFQPKKVWSAPDGNPKHEMVAWTNCMGVMLYFTRECLNELGGYDTSAANVYGYEHAQMSHRACKAGFSLGYEYLSPAIARSLIYSFDVSYGCLGEEPPTDIPWIGQFTSSVSTAEAAAAASNSILLSNPPIHIPLVDPLA